MVSQPVQESDGQLLVAKNLSPFAKVQIRRDDGRGCFVAVGEDSHEIAGYYTLTATSIALSALAPEITKKLPRYPVVPAVLLGRLAVTHAYQGQGLGGILALAIAERFGDRDIVALKPWPMNSHDNPAGVWELSQLAETKQKAIANKLRKSYRNAGFKPLFRGSSHLFLTHFRHPSVTQLIDKRVG